MSKLIGNFLFLNSESGTNPILIQADRFISWKKIYLVEYTINGVAVTSGVPDNTHFDLSFEQLPGFSIPDWIHLASSRTNVFPVLLTSENTHQSYSPPRLISQFSSVQGVKNFQIRLKDKDDNDATFTSCAFLFYIEN